MLGSVKTAAEFLSRLQLNVKGKICLKIPENIQTSHIEVSTYSSDVADEEKFFLTQKDIDDDSEQQTIQGKDQSRQKARE